MNTTTMQHSPIENARRALGRFMAVADTEWEVIRVDAKLGAEIVFHAVAVLYCSAFFGWAIFNIAAGLLGYPFLVAVFFAITAAFGLGSIDRHVRIQSRGAPEIFRGIIIKVRFVSVFIVALSGVFMTVNSFRDDVDNAIAQQKQDVRARLERAPKYAVEVDAARDGVDAASKAVARADDLRRNIAQLKVDQAREFAASKDEREGNETGNQMRIPGLGPKARGHENAARRLGQELEAAEGELSQLGNVSERLEKAKSRLGKVSAEIDREADALVQGPTKKLEALLHLVQTNAVTFLAVLFWIMVGMLPDIMMWIAFGRSPNDKSFANVREIQDQAFAARLATYRADLRRQAAEGLAPLDVRMVSVPRPTMAGDSAQESADRVKKAGPGQERA